MNNIIKCPICHQMAGLRYNENRVYQSRCQNMACRETVTVTAPSWKTAEELFSKFEKGTNQPRLSIPKKIAEELERVAVTNWEIWEFFIYAEEFSNELKNWLNHGKDDNANSKIAISYLAGKALGVELVEVSDE